MLAWQAALAGFGLAIVLAGLSIFVIELCVRSTKAALSMLIYTVPASVLAGLLTGPGFVFELEGLYVPAALVYLTAVLIGAMEAGVFRGAQIFRWQRK